MIRSSCHSIKDANSNKIQAVANLIQDSKNLTQRYINIIWNKDPINNKKSLLESSVCNSVIPLRSGRLRQACAKQACSIVNGTLDKRRKQLYKLKELQNDRKDCKHLQRKIDKFKVSKPLVKNFNLELDERFIDIRETSDGHFDLFVKISSIGNKECYKIPLKQNKVSKKWIKQGTLKKSIRLSNNSITLFYEVPDREKRKVGRVLGADQGIVTCLSLSDGQVTNKDNHGYDLRSIMEKLSRRKRGSKGFKRTQSQRKNYINWSLNQINFSNVKELRLEKLYQMRCGQKTSSFMTHFTYTLIKKKLVMLSEVEGFSFVEQDNKFRSQRCSCCGYVCKSNRFKKEFRCKSCGYYSDSDLNSALNHEANLIEVPDWVYQKKLNLSGFYWHSDRIDFAGKCIVSQTLN